MKIMQPEELWEGAVLANENGRVLRSGAEALADAESYGAASAISVLAAEEFSKSLGIMSRALSGSEEIKGLKKYFTDHKHKHSAAALLMGMLHLREQTFELMAEIDGNNEIPTEQKMAIFLERMGEATAVVSAGENQPLSNINGWRLRADEIKKRGFYVDRVGDSWVSPKSFTKEQYIDQMAYALELQEIVDAMLQFGSFDELRARYSASKNGAGNS